MIFDLFPVFLGIAGWACWVATVRGLTVGWAATVYQELVVGTFLVRSGATPVTRLDGFQKSGSLPAGYRVPWIPAFLWTTFL
jgi:hypothetical protein